MFFKLCLTTLAIVVHTLIIGQLWYHTGVRVHELQVQSQIARVVDCPGPWTQTHYQIICLPTDEL